jgi:hypothetical protein
VLIVTFVWVVLTPRLFPQTQDGDISAPYRNFSAPAFSLPNMNGEQVELQDLLRKGCFAKFLGEHGAHRVVRGNASDANVCTIPTNLRQVEIIAINMATSGFDTRRTEFIGTHELNFSRY